MSMKGITVLVMLMISLICHLEARAQQVSFKLKVNWLAPQQFERGGTVYQKPLIEGQEFTAYQPNVSGSVKAPKNVNYSSVVKHLEMVPAEAWERKYLEAFDIEIPTAFKPQSNTTNAGAQRYHNVWFMPYLLQNGSLMKITEVDFEFQAQQFSSQIKKDFAANSVLADLSSQWYKIAISTDGIYKLDKTWFDNANISLQGVSPDHIHLYGNAEGRLSEYNGDPKQDDLAENAMLFVGDNDADFESNEYFLFFAWGPNRWVEAGGVFRRDLNIYTDKANYFIRIKAGQTPKRINKEVSSQANPTNLVSTFNHFDIYEQDLKNLVGGGQRWYGEEFDFELSRTFNFNIPNVVTDSPVRLITSLGTNSSNAANTYTISVGGTNVYSSSLGSTSTDYRRFEAFYEYNTSSDQIPINILINRVTANTVTYLDKIELNARRQLVFTGQQFRFRDASSVGTGSRAQYTISSVPGTYFVWDITDKYEPKLINGNYASGTFVFVADADSLREFVISDGAGYYTPEFVKKVEHQNLHGLDYAKLLIVTHPDLISQANRLADIHRAEGLTVHVVNTEQVYNEFSSGMQDPTAIRWFTRMFYKRANGDVNLQPQNLLLFGDGTYDPKNRVSGNNYMIPTYQFISSEDHINALVSDDYFGMLDDNESISNGDMMDIGVGRMIVSDLQQATEMVDKVVQYLKEGINQTGVSGCQTGSAADCSSFGDWRQKYVQIADDEESGYFIVTDTEPQSDFVTTNYPDMNADKLYLDAYTQVSLAGGQRYPEVFESITDRIQRGALIVNYVGHGGEVGVAEERVITIPQIQSWTNWCQLNLFVSATCEFTKFDDPSRVSAGEWVYLNPGGGAIALMTTTRSVFFGVNTNVGKRFYENVFERDASGRSLTFGEIMMHTKNEAGANSNKRSFNLIGDPALRIALPEYRIITDSINANVPSIMDTIRALSKVRIVGHVEDYAGNKLTNFNGILTPTVFDKLKVSKTLGQDDDSPIIEFDNRKSVLYKGRSSVKSGNFAFEFIVPKDIDYSYGTGKVSLYANTETDDAGGSTTQFIVGGIDPNGLYDNTSPEVKLYFNNEKFINGGMTDENPILYADIFDENGINTAGNGIGHDILAILDGESSAPIVLNDYYSASLDTYQSGQLRYQFSGLKPGMHRLTLKVWDVNNNSSDAEIEFEVRASEQIELSHVLNYPNPFTTSTNFYFEHNQYCDALTAQVQIFTVSGKLVKTIRQDVLNDCFRSDGIHWDGLDEYGDKLARGVYIYKLTVKNSKGESAEHLDKCVILK